MLKYLKLLFIIIGLSIGFKSVGQYKFENAIRLSDKSQISILTVDRADEELFQAFGHICIYINDPTINLDKVYSYGSFNFNTENFYWKFITGRLPYQVSESNLAYTLLEYSAEYENRSVAQQELNLTLSQKQRILDILEENLLPENKTYQYKFFQDNCSTRIRDVFKKAMGDSLKFSEKGIEQGLGFRNWMNKNLPNSPWSRFGMNLAIGAPSDVANTNEETFYLPQNLSIAFDNALNGNTPILKAKTNLFIAKKPIESENIFTAPITLFWVLFFIGIAYSYSQYKNNNKAIWFDRILFLATGLLGILIVFLWFFTIHGVTQYNWNIIWALPTNLIFVFSINKKSKLKHWYLTIYQGIILATFGIGFLMGFFKNEIYPWAILPILLLLLVRISLLKINSNMIK
jgi:hypothetical protein